MTTNSHTKSGSSDRGQSQRRSRRWLRRRSLYIVGFAAISAMLLIPVGAEGGVRRISEPMDRVAPEDASPSGHSVIDDCQGPEGTDPKGWLNASAGLKITQNQGSSNVSVRVRHARPNTYYTIWLRLGGSDSNGDAFGGNPVTGGRATPLAATSDLPSLLAATGAGNGTDDLVNGFWTNRSGHATFRASLDFPIVAGAYPFQRFPDWDPTDPRLPADNPAIYPVAIAGPQGPFTLRMVSHCTDQVGHGLSSGPRELWFDWTVDS